MGKDVGVGVAEESPLEGYLYPAQDERPAGFVLPRIGVDIDAQADPENGSGAANSPLLFRARTSLSPDSRPGPGIRTGAEDGFGQDQVLRRSELDVRPLARHHEDAAPDLLDEESIVGRGAQALFGGRVGFA